jgi:hypothetical protein
MHGRVAMLRTVACCCASLQPLPLPLLLHLLLGIQHGLLCLMMLTCCCF